MGRRKPLRFIQQILSFTIFLKWELDVQQKYRNTSSTCTFNLHPAFKGDISKVSMNSKKETKTISCFTKFHLFFVLNQVWFNPFQSISIHPKNVRPPEVFWYFQGVQKWNMGLKWVNHIFWRNINSSGYGTNKMSAYRSTCSTIFLAKSFPNCKFLNYHYMRVKSFGMQQIHVKFIIYQSSRTYRVPIVQINF